MSTRLWSALALVLPLALVTACGGSQARPAAPEAAEPEASAPARETRSQPDPVIQPTANADPKPSAGVSAPAAPAGGQAQPLSDMEARIISGAALPPSAGSAPKAAGPTKVKKGGKGRKKS